MTEKSNNDQLLEKTNELIATLLKRPDGLEKF